jgi:hypothetical protein
MLYPFELRAQNQTALWEQQLSPKTIAGRTLVLMARSVSFCEQLQYRIASSRSESRKNIHL